jgi:hypothetical protein
MRNKKLLVALIMTAALVSSLVTAALATTSASKAHAVTAVKVVTSTDLSITSSDTWSNVAGGSTSIVIPASTGGLILVHFSGESVCSAIDGSYCSVRVLVGGAEAQPAPTAPTFDTASKLNGIGFVAHASSIDRVAGPLAAGTYKVQLQYSIHGSADACCSFEFVLQNWFLSVEVART